MQLLSSLMHALPMAAANVAEPWQLGFSEPVSPVAEGIQSFHDGMMIYITVITILVTALLAWVVIRYRESANPTPSKTTHNWTLEILWTLIPFVSLIVVAFPSISLLREQKTIPEADLTIKAAGYQWYWVYNYPDHDGIEFFSNMIEEEDLKPGQKRLLSVDNPIVVPVNKVVRMELTGADVLHAWALPAFGVKMDAVPGRLNATWFKATKTGTYYGQCSELCGVRHGFMPIEVRVVTQEEFDAWVIEAKERFAANDNTENTLQLAAK